MEIRNLQVNHLRNPEGIAPYPVRLTWCLEGGKLQRAYEVNVCGEKGEEIYQSGRVESGEMHAVLPDVLEWRKRYCITLRVWDEENRPSPGVSLYLTTGMEKSGWRGVWISPEGKHKAKERQRGGYLKKDFFLEKTGPARLYITAHGIFNVYLNGREVTENQFMPGTSQYNKRLMVETLEVGEFLQPGKNTLVVTLGDGWYRGCMGFMHSRNVFGTDISLLAQLEMEGIPVIFTGPDWLSSTDGPLGFNDLLEGEEYDARKEETMTWHPVKVMDFGFDRLIPADTVPMVPHERFAARRLQVPDGEVVFDFSQNMAGYVCLDLEAKGGEKIVLTHGEVLDGEGNFTTDNFQNPRKPTPQKVTYICRPGHNLYHPTKTYMGFRYVKVESDIPIEEKDLTAVAVYSDMAVTGDFQCGVPEVNRLFQNALWSMKGNFVDVPTDCPTREKSGYSGDAQVFHHTAMYLMDCYPVLAKWIREQAATQFEDGCVAQVAPSPFKKKVVSDGGVGWSDSFQTVPYGLWKRYGDDSLIRELYDPLKKWGEYRMERSRKKIRLLNRSRVPAKFRPYVLDSEWMWGEWLEPDAPADYRKNLHLYGDLEVSTAFLWQCCSILSSMAHALGKQEDALRFRKTARRARTVYRALFVPEGKIREEKRQCRYVRPLSLNLLTRKEKAWAAGSLARLVEENADHLNTGFLSTHALCRVLTDYGQSRKAYDLLLQRDAPGWLCSVEKGATTIPENWESYGEDGKPAGSFNHYSYGAVVGWLFDSVCGIRVQDGHITICPHPDRRLSRARGSYDSPLGRIESSWRYEDNQIVYEVTVPSNTKADLRLPSGRRLLESGTYTFAEEIPE